jgi:hypothetical protein
MSNSPELDELTAAKLKLRGQRIYLLKSQPRPQFDEVPCVGYVHKATAAAAEAQAALDSGDLDAAGKAIETGESWVAVAEACFELLDTLP